METRYYKDELNDDFASKADFKKRVIGDDYKYIHTNPFYRGFAFFISTFILSPLTAGGFRLFNCVKIKNKKALRKLKGRYIIYANHTQPFGDSVLPTCLAWPRKPYVIVNSDVVSIPGTKKIVELMGALPVPDTKAAGSHLFDAIKHYVNKGCPIAIYPEAHLWPYYNGVRYFKSDSFTYPFIFNVPCVAVTVIYRQRKIFKNKRPHPTYVISNPFYPKNFENKEQLRDKVYEFMKKTIDRNGSFAYINYVKKED